MIATGGMSVIGIPLLTLDGGAYIMGFEPKKQGETMLIGIERNFYLMTKNSVLINGF